MCQERESRCHCQTDGWFTNRHAGGRGCLSELDPFDENKNLQGSENSACSLFTPQTSARGITGGDILERALTSLRYIMELGTVLGLAPQSWVSLIKATRMKTIEGSMARKYCSNNKVKSNRPRRQKYANGPINPSQLAKPVGNRKLCWPTG